MATTFYYDFLTEDDKAEIGRTLGYDFKRFGMTPDFSDKNIQIGMKECQTSVKPDIFQRKWVRLRLNAYRRDIPFDAEGITPLLLERMFQDNPICPISLTPLKIGNTGDDADENWSIDRVMNNVGYNPHNLAVMSKAANTEKGSLTFEEISEREEHYRTKSDQEHFRYWARMKSLCAPVYGYMAVYHPNFKPSLELGLITHSVPVARLPYSMPMSVSVRLANAIAAAPWVEARSPEIFVGPFESTVPAPERRRLRKTVERVRELKRAGQLLNDCYFDDTLARNWYEFVGFLLRADKEVVDVVSSLTGHLQFITRRYGAPELTPMKAGEILPFMKL